MATRFGAVSPAHTYATKVRWLVACLVSVILVLAIAIIFIAQSGETTEVSQPQVEAQQPIQPVTPKVEFLVASMRIEEGTQLEDHMFNRVSEDVDKMPTAAVRAQNLPVVIGKFANKLINANSPLVMDDVSDARPMSGLSITPGYRLVTITVDARSGVEGYAKPNSRVDVLWTYAQGGKKSVATIARFIKVFSVSGTTKSSGDRAAVSAATTVTLLVTERDAKKIELARTLGELSLSVVGDLETTTASNEPEAVTLADLIGRPATTEPVEVSNDGVMYTSDPRTGRQLRYVLRNGRWSLDRSFGGNEQQP